VYVTPKQRAASAKVHPARFPKRRNNKSRLINAKRVESSWAIVISQVETRYSRTDFKFMLRYFR
jgi:hypothetical protein